MVEFTGVIDRRMLVRANRLQMAKVTPFAIMIMFAALYALLTSANVADTTSWSVPLFFLLFASFLLASPYLSARKALKTNKAFDSLISGTADENQFVFNSALGHADIPWEKMYRAVVQRELVLLYPSAQQSFVVARRFFPSDQAWETFCQLVRDHVRQQPQSRPVRTFLVWIAIIVMVFIVWSVLRVFQH